ncbi:MAG: P-loop NTPase [Candidatus Omnitrophica bacterium]|nr:P-loop NTPase [Candidatus Omnitrophota bacterium]
MRKMTEQERIVRDTRLKEHIARIKYEIPVIGIIENMGGFLCPHCKKEIDLFGMGGGGKPADDLKVPLLGRIPVEPEAEGR